MSISEQGKYRVEIAQQPGKPLSAEASAALWDHFEVNIDLERLHPGLYLVSIRCRLELRYHVVLK